MTPVAGSEISLVNNRGWRDSTAGREPIMNTSTGDRLGWGGGESDNAEEACFLSTQTVITILRHHMTSPQ